MLIFHSSDASPYVTFMKYTRGAAVFLDRLRRLANGRANAPQRALGIDLEI